MDIMLTSFAPKPAEFPEGTHTGVSSTRTTSMEVRGGIGHWNAGDPGVSVEWGTAPLRGPGAPTTGECRSGSRCSRRRDF